MNEGGQRPLRTLVAVLIALALGPGLTACSPTGMAVGAAATTGIAAAQERGLAGAAADLRIRARINKAWLEADPDMYRRVGLTVHGRRVLLTGRVPEPGQRTTAVRLAWRVDGVRDVINAVRVDPDAATEPSGLARDELIAAEIKGRLMADGRVHAINYAITVSHRVVHVLGIARSDKERQRVLDHIRAVEYVRGVRDHTVLASEWHEPLQPAPPKDDQGTTPS